MHLFFLPPIVAGAIAQIIKFSLKVNKQKFTFKNALSYSGMPSGHTAMVSSLVTSIGLIEGIYSPLFGFSLIFAIIIIRDAIGLRRYLGKHGQVLNELVKDLEEDDFLDEKYPKLLEKIGHTPTQVLIGGIIGFLTSLFFFLLF